MPVVIGMGPDDEPQIIEELPEEEPTTNLPGVLLGLGIAPFAIFAVVVYIRVIWCVVVHIWHWVTF